MPSAVIDSKTRRVKDLIEAVGLFRKASEQGYQTAQQNLGMCYYGGVGVIKDYTEAHPWFNLASAQGNEVAKVMLRSIEKQMVVEQISEAQRLAREFKPRQKLQ